jgi:hypothetical protein
METRIKPGDTMQTAKGSEPIYRHSYWKSQR